MTLCEGFYVPIQDAVVVASLPKHIVGIDHVCLSFLVS